MSRNISATDTLTDFHNLTSTTPLTGSVINKSEPSIDNSNITNQKAQNRYTAPGPLKNTLLPSGSNRSDDNVRDKHETLFQVPNQTRSQGESGKHNNILTKTHNDHPKSSIHSYRNVLKEQTKLTTESLLSEVRHP